MKYLSVNIKMLCVVFDDVNIVSMGMSNVPCLRIGKYDYVPSIDFYCNDEVAMQHVVLSNKEIAEKIEIIEVCKEDYDMVVG